jgi:hypothetical protein
MDERNSQSGRAVRLICRADEHGVRVVSRRRLNALVPPSDEVEDVDSRGRAGFWIEVRDAAGNPSYRRVMADPLADEIEVSEEDGTLFRRRITAGAITFALLVPDLDGADHVALLRGVPAGGRPGVAAGEVARLPLRGQVPGGPAAEDSEGRG